MTDIANGDEHVETPTASASVSGVEQERADVLGAIAQNALSAAALAAGAVATCQASGTQALRKIGDDTLLDMFDHAHEVGDAQCDAIAAELHWRGIEVPACKHPHATA